MSTDDTEPLPDPPPPEWMPPEWRQPKPTPPSPEDPSPNDDPQTAAIKRLTRLVRIDSTRAAREDALNNQRLREGAGCLTIGSLAGLLFLSVILMPTTDAAVFVKLWATLLSGTFAITLAAGIVALALVRRRR